MPSSLTLSPSVRPKRRYFTQEQRQQIAMEAMAPGVSVSAVARAHDLNTNQVFKWCRELRRANQEREVNSPELLLVSLTPPEVPKPVSPAESRQDGRIELHLKRGRMLITGEVNAEMLHAVLDRLLA